MLPFWYKNKLDKSIKKKYFKNDKRSGRKDNSILCYFKEPSKRMKEKIL